MMQTPKARKKRTNTTTKRITYHIGVDEVGRGPLAGPVTVCAFAILDQDLELLKPIQPKDSKILSEQKRDSIARELLLLKKNGRCIFQITSIAPEVIDERGLTHAITTAIQSVFKKLKIHPEHADVYLDGGLKAPMNYFRQHTIIKGDGKIPVISCASILAKVHRDQLMNDYDKDFPEYGFINHKGYGTPEHYRAIRKHGIISLHRKSFLKKFT